MSKYNIEISPAFYFEYTFLQGSDSEQIVCCTVFFDPRSEKWVGDGYWSYGKHAFRGLVGATSAQAIDNLMSVIKAREDGDRPQAIFPRRLRKFEVNAGA